VAIGVQRKVQFGGNLFLCGLAQQALLRHCDRGFHLLGTPALLARRPIHPAQAVQNSSSDFVLGVGFQLDVA